MTDGVHHRWAVSRALALLLALCGALGPTASALHLALAPHAICPEHGELIEVAGDSAHAAPGAAGQGRSKPASEQGDPGPGEHLHCAAVAPLRGPALSAPRPAFEVAAAPLLPAVNERAADAPLAPPCVLTCAPKQSPPRRA